MTSCSKTLFYNFQRYYYYIHHGIDTEHVAPMEDSWLENVLALISTELKDGHLETIDNLSDEMREDYLLSVKKAIGENLPYNYAVNYR